MMAVSLCRRLLRRKYPRTSTARDLCAGAQCLERGPRFQQIKRRSRATLYTAGAIDFSVTMTICGYATSGCWLMEQVDYNLLYRCFVRLSVDAKAWVVTTFTKNRDRL